MDKNPSSSYRFPSASDAGSSKSPERRPGASADEPFAGKLKPPSKATRRIRGEIACAECRRLKIKCDRVVPCSTCVKRGCGALCPNGTIPPGEGSRFVSAATDHLREKMAKLKTRMRCLEDAVAIMYMEESDQPHPLLAGSADMFADADEERKHTRSLKLEGVSQNSPMTESPLGTLLLDGRGGSRFFGPTAASEVSPFRKEDLHLPALPDPDDCVVFHAKRLFMEAQLPSSSSGMSPGVGELDPSYLPPAVNQCYQAFPLTPPNVHLGSMQETMEAYLPAVERASALCVTFLDNAGWMLGILSREDIIGGLIPLVYKHTPGSYGPHELAMLFAILAIGCLADLSRPPYDIEAQHYYRIGRATLALQPVLREHSLTTVKVLHLMSVYNGMSGKEAHLEESYALLDLASQIATKIGLHVDPASWGFKGRELYSRRAYFWTLMSGILWQSLFTGRPPTILTSSGDCRVPSLEEETTHGHGDIPTTIGAWGHRANLEYLVPLTKTLLSVKPPRYEKILELDRRIREAPIELPDMTPQSRRSSPSSPVSQRIFSRTHYQALMLLFLHRACFAQALGQHSADPLNCPWATSVRTAYSSACVVLQNTREEHSRTPMLCARVWRIWTFAFTAAIVVGAMAIHGPHLGMDPAPLPEFEAICKVFDNAGGSNDRVARCAVLLNEMLGRAYASHETFQTHSGFLPREAGCELSLLVGQTRVVRSSGTDSGARSSAGRHGKGQEVTPRAHQAHLPSSPSQSSPTHTMPLPLTSGPMAYSVELTAQQLNHALGGAWNSQPVGHAMGSSTRVPPQQQPGGSAGFGSGMGLDMSGIPKEFQQQQQQQLYGPFSTGQSTVRQGDRRAMSPSRQWDTAYLNMSGRN